VCPPLDDVEAFGSVSVVHLWCSLPFLLTGFAGRRRTPCDFDDCEPSLIGVENPSTDKS